MTKTLFLIFSHEITPAQRQDAEKSLGISGFTELPPELRELWGPIPPDIESVNRYLAPIVEWLSVVGKPGDYVLIQGDFGAVYHLVNLAFNRGLVPVYSTTTRSAIEEHGEDGTVRMTHIFRHVRFRRYHRDSCHLFLMS